MATHQFDLHGELRLEIRRAMRARSAKIRETTRRMSEAMRLSPEVVAIHRERSRQVRSMVELLSNFNSRLRLTRKAARMTRCPGLTYGLK